MKLHLRIFLLSVLAIVAAIVAIKLYRFSFDDAIIAQAQATSYMVTFIGVVALFGWYKQKAIRVEEGGEAPLENLLKQKRILYGMLVINILNAFVLLFSQEQPVQLMSGISLIVVLISPHLFRTMQEK